ncbi:MAG: mRNA surveillance protein pelota [Candidatus Bathyarchaeia archaeon]|nr:mRNA surveillance protein pelota [Candidatus Bathyarchaeota archaeon A05DMB-3]MDH7558594.1 mRNA surveillance protein pelota [Candidatus Bathyarchaeota archaeon]
MKILETNLKKGFVKVVPETFDDLWHLYNIIYKGDEVYAYTSREIKQDEKYARAKRGERVSVFMGVKVEKVAWDKLLGRLRVHGIICHAPEIVPTGAHHTLNIALNMPLTIVKEEWAHHHLERLETAKKTSEKPIIIVAVDDEGSAIATTTQYGVELKAEEKTRLPGKLEAEKRSTAVKEFFQKVLNSLRQIWGETRSPIAVIGVGFIKNDFVKFLEKEAPEIAKSVVDVKSVNNSGVAGIYEAIRSGVLTKTMKHLRVMEETEIVEEVLKRLGKGEQNVAYGMEEVHRAADFGAVETLILADTMLREAKDEERLSLEQLMKNVELKGGKIMVVSTEHEAGAKLVALSGIAALLRFVLPASH